MADTTDELRVFCLLAKLVEYDITTHQRMTEQYAEWKSMGRAELAKQKEMQKEADRLSRKLDRTSQELDQTRERLVNSREEYTAMEKQLKRVQEDLLATQAQLNERSMPGASQKQEHSQRLELLDELREVNKENLNLQKQLAGGMASNVAKVTSNPVASYRPRGIGPKN